MESNGVFQLDDGNWGYRFVIKVNGKTKTGRRVRDEYGKRFRTQRQAEKAREAAIRSAMRRIEEQSRSPQIERRTVREVYNEYCEKGREDRGYQTIRKQDSLWNLHLNERFGSKYVDEISVAEINDYLSELYYKKGYSYRYTESFLKMFYLIFGQAYSRNHLDVFAFNKLCKNKDTKIHMPKFKTDDEINIRVFNNEELEKLDKYFKKSNAETAYLLGRYCGLRINECFGLKWDHVHIKEGYIEIDRQMAYQNHLIKLTPVKTINARRKVYLCKALKTHLKKKLIQKEKDEEIWGAVRAQKRRFITDLDGTLIPSTEMVNCLPNGVLQTNNSMKYHAREIKKKYGIDFQYHFLRHTYGTRMAELNTPQHLLCDQMGHGKIETTQLYYLAVTKNGVDILQEKINQL